MTFTFHPEAEAELYAAIDHYEQCEEGLGDDFSIGVYSTLQNTVNHPEAWPILEEGLRRASRTAFHTVSFTASSQITFSCSR